MKRWIVGTAALIVATACTSPGAPDAASEPAPLDVTVELDAFSGLPNPTWTLSSSEARELAVRLRDLPQASAFTPDVGVLGYRGFRVSNPGGEGGIPETVYVSRAGWVSVGEPGVDAELFQDIRSSQALLIGLARERGYGEAVAR